MLLGIDVGTGGTRAVLIDSSGKVLGTGYQPGKSATLVRNPNWNASTDYRPAYLNQINISIGGDPNVIGRQVLTGSFGKASLYDATTGELLRTFTGKASWVNAVTFSADGRHFLLGGDLASLWDTASGNE